jgi:GAF domain-containing protein
MHDLVLEIDGDGVYRKIAPTNPGLLYRPPENLLGQSLKDMFPADEAEEYLNVIRDVLKTRGTAHIEYALAIKDQRHWFSAFVSPKTESSTVWVAQDITERKQAQTLQEAVYRIAAAAETRGSLDDLYQDIHQVIASVMPAENFYITIYDAAQDILRFPYFKDVADAPFMGGVQPGKGLTAYVLRTGKSLLCTQAVHDDLERRGEVKLLGVPSAIWLGVPLIVEGRTIGAMVVQHYSDPEAYGEREQHMLEFVSTQVALAINRKLTEEAIQAQLEELQRWHTVTLGREKRILDLKREVNDLLTNAGLSQRYSSAEAQDLQGT